MADIMQWLSQPYAQTVCVCVLFLLLIVPLYARLARQHRAVVARCNALESLLVQEMDAFSASNMAERASDRGEMGRSIRGVGDSVVQIMGEVSRTQQQQLDAFGAQLRVINQMEEQRMERLQLSVEERLKAYDRQMTRITQTVDERLSVNEQRLSQMRQTLDDGMGRLYSSNEKKLEQIRATVDEKLNETLDKRLGESFRTVSDRLEQVYKGLGEMQSLAVGVGDLKKVLAGVRTRGIWGEVQLGALLEQALAADQYDTNVAVKPGGTERVEFAVRLPGKREEGDCIWLPIDAKFPAEDYQRLLDATEAGNRTAIDAASRALEQTIRNEARRIQSKYIAPPHTTDFAIMFLPTEGLFAEVLRCRGIVERLQNDHRIVVTGPTTLLALLNSLQMGFRTVAIERRSAEVWALLGAVKTEFGKFADMLMKTQLKLQQASASIETATRKTRSIERKLKDVQTLSSAEMMAVQESTPVLLELGDVGGEDGL